MAKRKGGLGRGLDALLQSANQEQTMHHQINGDAIEAKTQKTDLSNLPIEFLQPGQYQPRKDMSQEALEELASSIKAQGVIQPIVVRPIEKNRYEIVAGERRWRASQLAGLSEIPVVIKHINDEAAIAMALIENIQREDLNPIEEAVALKRLQDEFQLTQLEVADAVGKSRSAVTNLLRLINLEAAVRKLLEHGDIEMGHAKTLLALVGQEQIDIAKQVVAKSLSVRQTEVLVRKTTQAKIKTPSQRIDPDIKKIEDDLTDQLGSVVMLQHTAKGKGRLTIKYNTLNELDGILQQIKKQQTDY